MSERAIMFFVVAALLGVAFFFPYENRDGYTPGTAAQQQPADDKAKDLGTHELAAPIGPQVLPEPGGLENDPLSPQTLAGGSGSGASGTGGWGPAAGNVAAARRAEADAIATKPQTRKGGFGEGVKLEGTYVCQLIDVPDADPPTITFHKDGTFADHRFLSGRVSSEPTTQPATAPSEAEWSGAYDIHGFTLEIIPTTKSSPMPLLQATISPVGDDEDLARPQKLYIEGKILQLRLEQRPE